MSSTSTSMPAEAKTCLVTGSTGYIGAHVCSALLSAGSTVHAAARTATKAEHLTRVLAQRHPAAFDQKRFQIVLVPDMCVEGAYDEAVKGAYFFGCFKQRADPLRSKWTSDTALAQACTTSFTWPPNARSSLARL